VGVRTNAISPEALEGFLGPHGAPDSFAVDRATRERVALAVAEGNNACEELP